MTRFQDFKPLRDAIDAQDIPKIQEFITEHPDWNYDTVAQNGASALWWALMPVAGKPISNEVVSFLLAYLKNDGTSLVSPVKLFMNRRPSTYIGNSSALVKLISDFENNYVQPVQAHNGLDGIARNAHNVHDPVVNKLVQENNARLYQKYKDTPFDDTDIQLCINILRNENAFYFNKLHPDSIQQSLARCLRLTDTREIQLENEKSVKLTLRQLLALVVAAAKDDDPKMIPEDCDAEDLIGERFFALLQSLHDAQNAYGPNEPSCWLGTFNRISLALVTRHALVLGALKGLKLTGELARLKMTATITQCLGKLGENESTRLDYYDLLLEELDPDLKPDAQAQFVKNNYPELLEISINRDDVEKEEAIAFFKTIEQSIPLNAHQETRDLLALCDYLKRKNKFDINQIKNSPPKAALEIVVEQISILLVNELSWVAMVKQLGLEPTSQTAKMFIYHWLNISDHVDEGHTPNLSFEGLDKKAQATNSQTSYLEAQKQQRIADAQNAKKKLIKNCLYNVAWELHKPALKMLYPEQSAWIDGLSSREINQLLTEEKIQFPLSAKVFAKLITKGLKLGITRNLSLKGLTFTNVDFRGFDFSGADLTNTIFNSCDLRLVVSDSKSNFTGCKVETSCRVDCVPEKSAPTFLEKIFTDDIAVIEMCVRGNYLFALLKEFSISSTVKILKMRNQILPWAIFFAASTGKIQFLKVIFSSPHCSSIILKEVVDVIEGFALLRAVANGHQNCVEAIVSSPYCTTDVLKLLNTDGNSALHYAIRYNHLPAFKTILSSPNFTTEVLMLRKTLHYSALPLALTRGKTEFVKAILKSVHCTPDVLKSDYGALNLAVRYSNIDCVKAILASIHCTPDVFKALHITGETALITAACTSESYLKAMLASPLCTPEDLMAQDTEGRSALMKALSRGPSGCITALLESDKFKPELLLLRDNDGNSLLTRDEYMREESLKVLLHSPHCTAEVLSLRNKKGGSFFDFLNKHNYTEHIRAIRDIAIENLLNLPSLNNAFPSPQDQKDIEQLLQLRKYGQTGFAKFLSGKWYSNHTVFAEKLFKKIKCLSFNAFVIARDNGELQRDLDEYLKGLPSDAVSLKGEFVKICRGMQLNVRTTDNDDNDSRMVLV